MAGKLECRFYEAEFPEPDEVVMVQVRRIADMGAYVSLLEYNNQEGMVLLSELSKRRIRSVSKLIRVGQMQPVMVIRVDKDKGYIDLSKRRVSPEDIEACQSRFAKSKAVHSIMRHVAAQSDKSLEFLCEQVAWPLYRKYPHAHDAFKQYVNEGTNIFLDAGLDAEAIAPIKDNLEIQITRRLTATLMRVRSKVEVSCFEYEGIDAVRESLMCGFKAQTTEDIPLDIKLIAPPLYAIAVTCRDKELGVKTVEAAMALIQTAIESKQGVFGIKSKPELVGDDERDKPEAESGDESGSDSGSEDQDETMGNANFDEAELLAKTKGVKSDDEDDK